MASNGHTRRRDSPQLVEYQADNDSDCDTFLTMDIMGGSRGGPGGHVPPLEHFKYIFCFDEYFCWCTCLAKFAYRLMNIA